MRSCISLFLVLTMMALSLCATPEITPDTDPAPQCVLPPTNTIDWAVARDEYFYLSKVMATDLGGNCVQRMQDEHRSARGHEPKVSPISVACGCPLGISVLSNGNDSLSPQEPGARPMWLRGNDPVVASNEYCNTDIRSHLREIFTFTLFFSPRTIVSASI